MAHTSDSGMSICRLLILRSGLPLSLAVCAALVSAGCGGDDATPTRPGGVRSLLADCLPVNDGLRCSARVVDALSQSRDVTNTATWSASPVGAARFTSPGVLAPVSSADVNVRVEADGLSNSNPVDYRMAPGAIPRQLTFVGVTVLDTSRAPIFRASVQIIAGTGAGQSCITNEGGSCSLRPILHGEPLTIRVSAEGYGPEDREHRVDPFPGTPFVTVLLGRRP